MATILFVDDEDEIFGFEEYLKKELKCEWLRAYSGEEGIRYAKEACPDLILLDLIFDDQEMQGEDILVALKKISSLDKTPIIMLTHRSEGGHEEKLLYDLGADIFIHKPITLDKLAKCVRRELNNVLKRKER